MNERQPYVTVFVHARIFDEAQAAFQRLESRLGATNPDVVALRNMFVFDYGKDAYGYLPNARRSQLLPKADLKVTR